MILETRDTVELWTEQDLAEIKSRVEGLLKEGPAAPVIQACSPNLDETIREAFSESIRDVLIGAWRKWAKIRAYADPEKHPPGKPHIVPLFEHEVCSVHEPTISLVVNEKEVQKLECQLTLKIAISGIQLTILTGRIVAISSGDMRIVVEIGTDKGKLWEKKFKKLRFPGEADLGDGIPILGP